MHVNDRVQCKQCDDSVRKNNEALDNNLPGTTLSKLVNKLQA